jgi:hypothetical protein
MLNSWKREQSFKMLILAGDAGMGKTQMMNHISRSLSSQSSLLLGKGRCSHIESL